MILNLFILGCLKEKPLHLDFLLETANFIKLDRWTTYRNDLLLDRVNSLVELNHIKISKEKSSHFEKHQYASTEMGINFFRKELEKYIQSEEVNMGMLILFLTFSSHFSRDEIMHLIEKKIADLNQKLGELQGVVPAKNREYSSTLGYLSLKTSLSFRQNEIILYEDFLIYLKEHLPLKDFLILQNEFAAI